MEWEKLAKSKFVGEKRFRSENPPNDNFFQLGFRDRNSQRTVSQRTEIALDGVGSSLDK